MSAISSSQLEEITRRVRQQISSESSVRYSSVLRDERTWTMLIRLQSYVVDVLEDLHNMAKSKKDWQYGLDDIRNWSDDVRKEEMERLLESDATLNKKYEFTVIRYIKHLHRNAKSHRFKLNIAPFQEFVKIFLKFFLQRTDVQQRHFIDFGPSDQQSVMVDTLRLTMDHFYNKQNADADLNFVTVGQDSIIGGGSIAPSESVSCVGARHLSTRALQQHKEASRVSVSKSQIAGGGGVAAAAAAPSRVRSRVSKKSTTTPKPFFDMPASRVSSKSKSSRFSKLREKKNDSSQVPSQVPPEQAFGAAPRQATAPPKSHVSEFREVHLGAGGTPTQVSSASARSKTSKFRQPPRHTLRMDRAPPSEVSRTSHATAAHQSTVSSRSKPTADRRVNCFFDLNSNMSNDVQSHAV
jgi:hypothetical protein